MRADPLSSALAGPHLTAAEDADLKERANIVRAYGKLPKLHGMPAELTELAVCYGIVTRHAGSLMLDRRPGGWNGGDRQFAFTMR